MARRIDWTGVYSPAVTPFTETGEINETGFREVLDYLIGEGADGIIVAGCTGEWFSLGDSERARLFAVAREHIDGRAKVIAGTCAIATHQTIGLTQAAKDAGCDGAMIMAPCFIAPRNVEIVQYYADIAKVGLPIMVYSIPEKGHHNLDADLIEDLKAIDEVVAIKDSALSLPQMIETANRHSDWLAIFPGREGYAPDMIERGAAGITAMMMNVVGRHAVTWYEHLAAGRWVESRADGRVIDAAYGICLSKTFKPSRPTGHWPIMKESMKIRGVDAGFMRRPFLPLPAEDRPALERALAAIGLGPYAKGARVAAQ